MSSLSKIVKSYGVVDDRKKARDSLAGILSVPAPRTTVIKKGALDPGNLIGISLPPPVPDSLQQINRLKLELQAAHKQLRQLEEQLEQAKQGRQETAPSPAGEQSVTLAQQQQILEQARQEADEILANARWEALQLQEQVRSDGYLEGFQKGSAEAEEEFRRQCEPQANQLQEMLDDLGEYYHNAVRRQDEQILQLILAIVRKVLGRELKADPKTVLAMLRETIEENRQEKYIRITISDSLLPVEAKASQDVIKLLSQSGEYVTVQVQPDLPQGTLLVETPKGFTDLSVDTQLANIRQAMDQP